MMSGFCLMIPLGGCLLNVDKPEPGLDIPQAYSAGPGNPVIAEAAVPPLDWWKSFHSKELTEIIEEARVSNLDIAAAVARIVQADAQARIAGAALLPYVEADGSATRMRSSQNSVSGGTSGFTGGGSPVSSQYSAVLNASYEIDFWGKNRAALRAAEQTAVASRYDREVIGLTTVVAAANAYFQVLAAQDRLKAARDNLESANRVLNLIKQRLNAGTASALDTSQQQALVDTQRAAIPPLEQTLRQNKVALAVLIAHSPEHVVVRGSSLHAIAIPRITPGLPSELLTQRPDIREAEAQLAAADANVENARAQFLPSITLTGQGGFSSAVLKTLFEPQSVLYSMAAGVAQPVFDGAKLLGNLDLQKGRQDELLQDYRKAVISGFADVENALDGIKQTTLREKLQRDVVTSSRQAFQISEQRLREGTVDLVTVLQTQQTLYQAQDVLSQAQLARLQAVVSLYQALGGGWLPKPVETANAR
jgi:NodT family efflux transporter outer membrane factor (OMF) lipoprotein